MKMVFHEKDHFVIISPTGKPAAIFLSHLKFHFQFDLENRIYPDSANKK